MKNKMNILTISILFILLAVLFTSCKSNTIISNANTIEKTEKALNNNKFQIKIDLENGTLTAEVNYLKSDLLGTSFLLNRDFTIQKIICDGDEINPEEIKELINYEEDYLVNLYNLPKFENNLTIQYTGFLSGNTGISPYVKEKISKDFTFLRWETYYYPIFADNWEDTLKFLSAPVEAEITIEVPNGYLAVTPLQQIKETKNSDTTSFVYYGNISDFNCAIANYTKLSLSSGEFYFLENRNVNELSEFTTSIMDKSQQYMNEHFGKTKISPDMKYIVIPENFGSFVVPNKAVYIQASSFQSAYDMGQLIHEFIHLGWNAMPQEGEIQRARFFDEGFTSYFTIRVLGNLLGEDVYNAEIERYKESYKSKISNNHLKFIPISEYGKYEYGDLSYSIGPIFFDELCKIVGVETFDTATKVFLEKYRNTPVDFNTMCKEYIDLCNNPKLEKFFQDWLFTTKGYEQYINP